MTWHIITTDPRREFALAGHLVGRGVTVYCPTYQITKRRGPSAKRVRIDRPMFPGYLFAMASDATARAVRSATGFRGYLCGPEGPSALSEAAVAAVRQIEEELALAVKAKHGAPFLVGDTVRLSAAPEHHPFCGFDAIVQRLDNRDRATLCLMLHGRSWQIVSPAQWLELMPQSA